MSVSEHPLQIAGPGFEMLGILSLPAPGAANHPVSVLVVVGGAQYRVGSHRQFVHLARHLAAAGHAVLRFDLPGMGDSPGEPLPFEATAPCIAAALDALHQQSPSTAGTVLWGLCDGASASLLYVQATHDPRVAGLALLNPWVRSEVTLARTQVKNYYPQRLRQPDFWRKLLRGGVGWSALKGLVDRLRHMRQPGTASAGFQERMAQGWQAFSGPLLLLLSERDLTAQEFLEHARASPVWRQCLQQPGLTQHTIEGADHTCSQPPDQRAVMAHTAQWLGAAFHGQ
ncbi:MAG: hydrolase 1, exosortase A system-associated [Simplicispira sp.]|nr:hydrolase 1, exosortase A system-associated [Simplicispira sp.]